MGKKTLDQEIGRTLNRRNKVIRNRGKWEGRNQNGHENIGLGKQVENNSRNKVIEKREWENRKWGL